MFDDQQQPKSTWRAVLFLLFSLGLLGGMLYAVWEMAKHVVEGK